MAAIGVVKVIVYGGGSECGRVSHERVSTSWEFVRTLGAYTLMASSYFGGGSV